MISIIIFKNPEVRAEDTISEGAIGSGQLIALEVLTKKCFNAKELLSYTKPDMSSIASECLSQAYIHCFYYYYYYFIHLLI